MSHLKILSFSPSSPHSKKLLKRFVQFHWDHYLHEEKAIPLLNFEYTGFSLLGITGYFEPKHPFFQHGETELFLAMRGDQIVGRCNAFVNFDHNEHWKDRVGFFGNFECIDDVEVAQALMDSAEAWVRGKGMDTLRGPQNFPINAATPGFLVEGFHSAPVIYYPFNYPYYPKIFEQLGYQRVMDVISWNIPIQENDIGENLSGFAQKIMARYPITIEHWEERPFSTRKKEMLEIYNDAWNENFGFVPFREADFEKEVEGLRLVMDKKLFLFAYINGELAGFFGGVPNVLEQMHLKAPGGLKCRGGLLGEGLRAVRILLFRSKIRDFRLGYLGVKRKFHQRGLDGILLWKQSQISKSLGYQTCEAGWVLENNKRTIQLLERCGGTVSKRYSIFEKHLAC